MRRIVMTRPFQLCSYLLAGMLSLIFLNGCEQQNDDALKADIRYTSWGIPHIKAADHASLGFGMGYAYARDNLCMLADQVVTVNGQRSRYFGATGKTNVAFAEVDNLSSDVFFKTYFDDATLKSGYESAPAEARELMRGYVAGYNRYLRESDTRHATCRGKPWLRPITDADLYRLMSEKAIQASGGAFLKAIVTAQPPVAAARAMRAYPQTVEPLLSDPEGLRQLGNMTEKPFGSNAYALGKQVTGSGLGMLLGNPHFPWATTNRFYQLHLTIPGKLDVMGATIGGVPGVLIGFNRDVAWSHTVSTTQRFTLYELKMDPQDPLSYIYDGTRRKLQAKTVTVEVIEPSGVLSTQTRTVYFSHFGPIVINPPNLNWTADKAYTLRDANLGNTRIVEQWFRLDTARNVQDVKRALYDVTGLPWVNTIAADRAGDTLYADIGAAPNVSAALYQQCGQFPLSKAVYAASGMLLLDGSTAACEWVQDPLARQPGLFGGAAMPSLLREDYVANGNDSYWLSNPKQPLTGFSPVFGPVGTVRTLRTRLGIMQIEQRLAGTDGLPGKGFDSLASLQSVMFGNRLLAAELTLDTLLAACQQQSVVTLSTGEVVDLSAACGVLSRWDRKVNLDSVGVVVFREFWRDARKLKNIWAVPFNPNDPVHTPNTLNTADPVTRLAILQHLGLTVKKLTALGINLSVPLQQLQFVRRNGVTIGLHGGDDFEGAFNKITMTPLTTAGYTEAVSGSSYIQTVSWDRQGPIAEAMLTYSQSTDPDSSHFMDQAMPLYQKKVFAKLPFSDAEIQADPNYRRLLIRE
ncbi:acylase [Chitinivorax sp. B]|uniref:acylase n=1 Tax=Chitinivorax sp. B TaxID=2502235 RepID=UPI0010FA0B20|nr:acylase [Chitinivorax sp. B]